MTRLQRKSRLRLFFWISISGVATPLSHALRRAQNLVRRSARFWARESAGFLARESALAARVTERWLTFVGLSIYKIT